jgi:hypothetical protein
MYSYDRTAAAKQADSDPSVIGVLTGFMRAVKLDLYTKLGQGYRLMGGGWGANGEYFFIEGQTPAHDAFTVELRINEDNGVDCSVANITGEIFKRDFDSHTPASGIGKVLGLVIEKNFR